MPRRLRPPATRRHRRSTPSPTSHTAGTGVGDYPASRQLAVGQLVWSIINIVMGFMPLGIAALVMTILAQSADWASQEKRRLRAAMVLNIISSCLLPLVVLLFFALLIGSLAAY